MKHYFDPEKVMTSFRKMAVLLEDATETDMTLADSFLKTINAVKTERRQSFSRKQIWELEQMEAHLEQKLILSETAERTPQV